MAETLYRKYRPQTFADLVGQQHVRITLEHALEHDRVAHAYLFTGPRGVGKTTTARLLARAVNCTKRGKKAEPCNTCEACKAALEGRVMDIIEIDAASQTGVDNVRENVIQSARSIPAQLKMKVFIIDEVHMLSTAAFNALLKLLEEPPAHAMFILATTEPHRIPETIISRTQRFDFRRIPFTDMIDRLKRLASAEKRELASGVAERVARQAGGSLRDAESMLGQLLTIGNDEVTMETADIVLPRSDHAAVMEMVDALVDRRGPDAMGVLRRVIDDGSDLPAFAAALVEDARAVMLCSVDPTLIDIAAPMLDRNDQQRLLDASRRCPPDQAARIVDTLLGAQRKMSQTDVEEIPLELAVLHICFDGGTVQAAPPQFTRPVTPAPTEPKIAPPVAVTPDVPSTRTVESPVKKTKTTRTSSVSREELDRAWEAAVNAIAATSPGLALSLKQAHVTAWDGEIITAGIPHRFHADRLNDLKNRTLIETALQERLNMPVSVRVQHDEHMVVTELPPSTAPDTSMAREQQLPVAAPQETALKIMAKQSTRATAPTKSGNELWDQVVSTFS